MFELGGPGGEFLSDTPFLNLVSAPKFMKRTACMCDGWGEMSVLGGYRGMCMMVMMWQMVLKYVVLLMGKMLGLDGHVDILFLLGVSRRM